MKELIDALDAARARVKDTSGLFQSAASEEYHAAVTGIVTALGRVQIDAPIVIRLDGTNADLGRELLQPHLSDALQMQPTMLEAARTAVALAEGTAK